MFRARATGERAGRRFAHGRDGTLVLALVAALLPVTTASFASGESSVEETANGVCHAEVEVPALWHVEPLDVVRREPSARFEISPARFLTRSRQVVVRDASTELEIVPPVLAREVHHHPLGPATTRWVRGGPDGTLPLGDGDRRDVAAAGIDLDRVAPGTCLVEHYRPPPERRRTVRVLVREAHEQLATLPARFERERRELVLHPEYSRLIEVPTVWREEERRVMVQGPVRHDGGSAGEASRLDLPAVYRGFPRAVVEREATLTRVVEPAVVETLEVERLLVDASVLREPQPATYADLDASVPEGEGEYFWLVGGGTDARTPPLLAALPEGEASGTTRRRAGARPAASDDPAAGARPTGRRLCRREMPPETLAYERVVVREPARVERTLRPEKSVRRSVRTRLADARAERIERPAVVERVERRVQARPARLERRPVLCESEVRPALVRRLQRALARAGFAPGPADGVLGRGTTAAVADYQRERSLARGALTLETLRALGVRR